MITKTFDNINRVSSHTNTHNSYGVWLNKTILMCGCLCVGSMHACGERTRTIKLNNEHHHASESVLYEEVFEYRMEIRKIQTNFVSKRHRALLVVGQTKPTAVYRPGE